MMEKIELIWDIPVFLFGTEQIIQVLISLYSSVQFCI